MNRRAFKSPKAVFVFRCATAWHRVEFTGKVMIESGSGNVPDPVAHFEEWNGFLEHYLLWDKFVAKHRKK